MTNMPSVSFNFSAVDPITALVMGGILFLFVGIGSVFIITAVGFGFIIFGVMLLLIGIVLHSQS